MCIRIRTIFQDPDQWADYGSEFSVTVATKQNIISQSSYPVPTGKHKIIIKSNFELKLEFESTFFKTKPEIFKYEQENLSLRLVKY